jgi:hypothetical protein
MKKHTKKNIKKNNRKTKHKRGGDVMGMIKNVFNARKDTQIGDNYYETTIDIDKTKYKIHYFTPNNKMFLKTTDQIKTPTFSIHLDKKPAQSYTIKIDKYIVSCILKIFNPNNIKSFNWYVITRGWEHIAEGNISNSPNYKIYTGVFSNNKSELTLNADTYTKENNSLTLDPKKYKIIDNNDKMNNIILNFYVQQNMEEEVKEDVPLVFGEELLLDE